MPDEAVESLIAQSHRVPGANLDPETRAIGVATVPLRPPAMAVLERVLTGLREIDSSVDPKTPARPPSLEKIDGRTGASAPPVRKDLAVAHVGRSSHA